ncbi:hypothetical protein H6770_04190 [Candidatus Peribacteria bacterium]|nr:hypothetical protein [Candidatus Peribacteria bacterium]
MLKRNTEPHEFTWFLFLLTQGTATTILWESGGGKGALSLAVSCLFTAIVFGFSFLDGKRNITRSDIACLAIALAAFPLWLVLKQPLAATLVLTSIDLLAYVPTFRKSFSDPWSEEVLTWTLFFAGDVFAIAALEQYTLLTMVYLVSVMSANIAVVLFLLLRRHICCKN